jgi:hypothetical protein
VPIEESPVPTPAQMTALLAGFPIAQALYVVAKLGAATALADGPGPCRPAASGSSRMATDPDALAVTLLATLQGTLLLAQVQWDACLLETAVDTLLQLARGSRPHFSAGSGAPVP